jgi:hypothetical protein
MAEALLFANSLLVVVAAACCDLMVAARGLALAAAKTAFGLWHVLVGTESRR